MYGQSSNCFTNKAAGVFHPGKDRAAGHTGLDSVSSVENCVCRTKHIRMDIKKDGPKTVLNSISKSDYSATTSNLAVPLMSL